MWQIIVEDTFLGVVWVFIASSVAGVCSFSLVSDIFNVIEDVGVDRGARLSTDEHKHRSQGQKENQDPKYDDLEIRYYD